MIDGKDIEEPQELALGWDAATCTWIEKGDAETYRLNKERRTIIELLEQWDEPLGPKTVAKELGKEYNATRQLMYKMFNDGQLNQEGYGKYVVARGPVYIDNTSNTSTNGTGVNDVNDVSSYIAGSRTSSYISADEGNKRVQDLIDAGMKPEFAVAEVMKRMREE
jgi:hypothetical protein